MEKQKHDQIKYDLIAIFAGMAILSFFLITANRTMGYPDEAFYLSIAQRILQGDKILVHEWGVEQLASLFLIIPYKLYVSVFGGTEGIILAFRYLFVAVDAVFYIFMYRKFRAYKLPGLLCTVLFCGIIPPTGLVLNYYTISLFAYMQALQMLCDEKPLKKGGSIKYISIGAIWAFGILAEPLTIFVYLIYIVFFAVCKIINRYRFRHGHKVLIDSTGIRNNRAFIFISIGGWSVFACFIAMLYFTGSLKLLPLTLKYLVTDVGYSPSDIIDPYKISSAVNYFGKINFVSYALLLIVSVISYSDKDKKIKRILFYISCVILASFYFKAVLTTIPVRRTTYMHAIAFHELPILLITPIWYLINGKRDPKKLVFIATSLLFSLFVDISSDWEIGLGGHLAFVPAVLLFNELVSTEIESRKQLKSGNRRISKKERTLGIIGITAVCVCSLIFCFWTAGYELTQQLYPMTEKIYLGQKSKIDASITQGPNKGLITTSSIKQKYDDSIKDFEMIRALNTDSGPILIFDLYPQPYLYLDFPYATTTTYFSFEEKRLKDYWTLFPEKRPMFVYIPDFDAWNAYQTYSDLYESYEADDLQTQFDFFSSLSSYEIIEGNAGSILVINSFK